MKYGNPQDLIRVGTAEAFGRERKKVYLNIGLTLSMSEVHSRLTLKDLRTNLQRAKMILKYLR